MKSTFCYLCGSLWLASESFEIIKVQTPYLNAKLSELKSTLAPMPEHSSAGKWR